MGIVKKRVTPPVAVVLHSGRRAPRLFCETFMVSCTKNRLSPQAAGLDAKRLAVSYGGSIAINALFLALMFVSLEAYPTLSNPGEIAIEVTIETARAAPQAIKQDAAQ